MIIELCLLVFFWSFSKNIQIHGTENPSGTGEGWLPKISRKVRLVKWLPNFFSSVSCCPFWPWNTPNTTEHNEWFALASDHIAVRNSCKLESVCVYAMIVKMCRAFSDVCSSKQLAQPSSTFSDTCSWTREHRSGQPWFALMRWTKRFLLNKVWKWKTWETQSKGRLLLPKLIPQLININWEISENQ